MICSYGMSDRIGPVALTDDGQDVFLGRDLHSRKDYSEKKAQEIDEEVTTTLRDLYNEAKQLLEDHRDKLDRISEALLERETLDHADLVLIQNGEPLPPLPPPPVAPEKPTSGSGDPKPESGFAAGDKLPDPEPVPG